MEHPEAAKPSQGQGRFSGHESPLPSLVLRESGLVGGGRREMAHERKIYLPQIKGMKGMREAGFGACALL
jgi:hypothetical protein